MKRFIEYLKESVEEKKYTFKIKIAGELPDHCEDVMERSLQQYQVSRFTKGKSTPISSNLLDFPTIKNAEMTVFEVDLDYPTTSAVLTDIISNSTGITKDRVKVRTPLEEENAAIETEHLISNEEQKQREALLNQDYEKSNNQKLAGAGLVSSFLKDISKASKETGLEQYKCENDALLAKKMPKEKANVMPAAGPARSLFGGNKKD